MTVGALYWHWHCWSEAIRTNLSCICSDLLLGELHITFYISMRTDFFPLPSNIINGDSIQFSDIWKDKEWFH